MMTVIDVIYPYMPGASNVDDHIEVTCVPSERAAISTVPEPALHPTMSVARTLAEKGRMPEAVVEALRLIEERVRSLTASDGSGFALMESVFDATSPRLDITTATGQAAEDERAGFRLLFMGVILGLAGPHRGGHTAPATLDETLEYLAVASMLMRRLDQAESRLGEGGEENRG